MRSFHHFTLEERARLHEARKEGKSLSEIAGVLGRNVSSISRELKRNTNKDGSYTPLGATYKYLHRRKRSIRKPRLTPGSPVTNWIMEKLGCAWPPEAIAARWRLDHQEEKFAFSTIYRALHKGQLKGCTPKTHLRRRGKRKYKRDGRYNTIKPEHTIHQRPQEANLRQQIGHFEGDTICGSRHEGMIVTLVDRKSRYLVAAPVCGKGSSPVAAAMLEALRDIPVASITLDNGAEFAKYKEIEQALKTTVYFADPHAPWQRGSNENINGALRFFFPKSMCLSQVTPEHLRSVVNLLNDRPRKCLGWLSPRDLFFSQALCI